LAFIAFGTIYPVSSYDKSAKNNKNSFKFIFPI